MSGVSQARDSLRQARTRLALNWERTGAGWQDKRAREFEQRYHVPLEQAISSFERALAKLDKELDGIAKELPDR